MHPIRPLRAINTSQYWTFISYSHNFKFWAHHFWYSTYRNKRSWELQGMVQSFHLILVLECNGGLSLWQMAKRWFRWILHFDGRTLGSVNNYIAYLDIFISAYGNDGSYVVKNSGMTVMFYGNTNDGEIVTNSMPYPAYET